MYFCLFPLRICFLHLHVSYFLLTDAERMAPFKNVEIRCERAQRLRARKSTADPRANYFSRVFKCVGAAAEARGGRAAN